MDANEILECQFSRWYPQFHDIAFRSTIIQLPAAFVDYLVQDGVFLGNGSRAMLRRAEPASDDVYTEWSDSSHDAVEEQPRMPEFPELMEEFDDAIMDLGGRVAPKLNWSSPHDAVWISSTQSLGCSNAEEVLLLLKSSDRIAHDICSAFDGCGRKPAEPIAYTLALRKWIALKPEREFRCFVRGHDLIAVSQRNIRESPGNLELQKDDLAELLLEFFVQHVQQRFSLSDYTFDVYITSAGKVRLMDFNPIGGTTSPLLFDWEELQYSMPVAAAAEPAADNMGSMAGVVRTARPKDSSPQEPAEGHSSGAALHRGDSDTAPAANGSHRVKGLSDVLNESATADVPAAEGIDAEASGCPAAQQAAERGQSSSAMGYGSSNGGSGGHSTYQGSAEIMIRFSKDSGAIMPNVAAYGAPYDMVDCSDGSAISEMLQRLTASHGDDSD